MLLKLVMARRGPISSHIYAVSPSEEITGSGKQPGELHPGS